MPPTKTARDGFRPGAPSSSSRARTANSSRSAGIGGSAGSQVWVRRFEPVAMMNVRGASPGLSKTASVEPPPMSTTSSGASNGAPRVTPRSVSSASSAWSRTTIGWPIRPSTMSETSPASAARRKGSVPSSSNSWACQRRAVVAKPSSASMRAARAAKGRRPSRSTIPPRPSRALSSANDVTVRWSTSATSR